MEVAKHYFREEELILNKKIEKEHDTRQRFSLRKLSVGLASVLVGVSFMTISAGQTVHADQLQTPGQSDLATQKADNVTNDSANDNEQNQAKSDTAQTINHVDPNDILAKRVRKFLIYFI